VEIKRKSLLSKSIKGAVREVVGTCGSLGITVDGLSSKDAQRAVLEGKYDDLLA